MSVSRINIGVDPGAKGGICIDIDNIKSMFIMPQTSKKVLDASALMKIIDNLPKCDNIQAVIEDVHSIFGASASSNFSFGFNCGFLEGLFSTFQIPYTKISPKTWQKEMWMGVPIIKDSKGKKDTKGMSLIAAKRLFPKEMFLASERCRTPHDGMVDAALICEYCKRKF